MKKVVLEPLDVEAAMAKLDKTGWSENFYKLRAKYLTEYDKLFDKISSELWRPMDGYEWKTKTNKAQEEAKAYRKKNKIKEPRLKDHYKTVFDHNYTRFRDWEQLAPYLNGYVRMLEYQVTAEDYHKM